MKKPSVFVAASSESLPIAEAILFNLEYAAEVTAWSTDIFHPSSSAIESLSASAESFDFAVFVFAPDDIAIIRGKRFAVVRDNVVLELGMFLGKLGRNRCFLVRPRDNDDLHLPSDLEGFTPATYDSCRSDRNWQAALAYACIQIKQAMAKLGRRERKSERMQFVPEIRNSLGSESGLIVDQELSEPSNLGASINEGFRFIAQTFKAGTSGILAAVSVNIHSKRLMNPDQGFSMVPLRIAIRETNSGFPSRVLSDVTLNSDQSLINEIVHLSSPIAQERGRLYAIVVDYPSAKPAGPNEWVGNWIGCTNNRYKDGNLCQSRDGISWFMSSIDDNDVHFCTFVRPLTL